ncbi:50S ribosomal protein L15e [Candidatus Pacearchaeota archaeon]|nr:50S ribosomal protein L15e [Candidatus Pacearchaeota archaeon]
MGMYKYIDKAMKDPESLRKKMIEWRRGGSFVRLEKPSNIGKARILGYKDKKGFVIVRVKIVRGGRKRPTRKKNRRSKRQTIRKNLQMNYRWVAEQRAARKYRNLEVLNSYWLGKDGIYYFFEVILVDPRMPEIFKDEKLKWLATKRGRVFRGLTSAARKSRGLRA